MYLTSEAIMRKIQVKIKNIYGKETIYPVCKDAILFTKLVGQKTLTQREINSIKELGYVIEVIQEVVAL